MNKYLVDGRRVDAESPRHAAKYHLAVTQKIPDAVEDGEKHLMVFGFCESTGLAIFIEDTIGVEYDNDSDGICWLTEAEMERMAKL